MAAGTTKQTVRSRRMVNAARKGMHSIKVSGHKRRDGKPPSVKIPPQLVATKCMLKSPPETLLNKDPETVPRQRSVDLIEFSV